jgi:sugar phosphate isomerase/epimerase
MPALPEPLPPPRVGLSTSSVFPDSCTVAFELAERLGYDGVEVMVWTDPLSQDASVLQALSDLHGVPVLSVHAPTLLLTQGVWGSQPWDKVDRSMALAAALGAPTVVLHPPFLWQGAYAQRFVAGVAARNGSPGPATGARDGPVGLAVENMYPWRAGPREIQAYLPHWDPVGLPYEQVTLDLSHTATSGADALAMAAALGPRLAHLHLADGLGSPRDEHLVPGRGGQPCAEVLALLARDSVAGSVIVEINTRRRTAGEREVDCAESLQFARRHLDPA